MKKFINITLVFILALFVFSCRDPHNDDVPVDVHEHDEIGKVIVKLTNKNDNTDVQSVEIVSGKAKGHFHLHKGETYLSELFFLIPHGDHDHTSDEIEKEKDHHFITYAPANGDIKIIRSENDVVRTDGQRLGIRTEWTINSLSHDGKMNIKLIHGPTSVNQNYPSSENQQGQTTGGSSDIDITVEAH